MNTSHGLGRSLIRRMRAATSSPSERGTRSLADRLADYTASPPPVLRSRCVVHTSSGSVGTHGATTGRQLAESVARGELGIGEYGVTCWLDGAAEAERKQRERLWGEWGWTE